MVPVLFAFYIQRVLKLKKIIPCAKMLIEKINRRKGQGKAIPVQPWTGPEGPRRLKLLDFKVMGP